MFKHNINNIAGMCDYFANKAKLEKVYGWYNSEKNRMSDKVDRPYYPFIHTIHATIKETQDRWNLAFIDFGKGTLAKSVYTDYVDEGGHGFIFVQFGYNTGRVFFRDFRPHALRAFEHRKIDRTGGSRVFSDVRNEIIIDTMGIVDIESGGVLYSFTRSGVFMGFKLRNGQYMIFNTFISYHDAKLRQREFFSCVENAINDYIEGKFKLDIKDYITEKFQEMNDHDIIEYINPKSGMYFESANKQSTKIDEEWDRLWEMRHKEEL